MSENVRTDAGGLDSVRLRVPNRARVELHPVHLDALIGPEHPARAVWAFVEGLDLGPLLAGVQSVAGSPGRPATDPRVLLALWLFATVEGVGSARALARLAEEHDAYRWICGGVSVNHHTLSDFRVAHVEFLDGVLTESVAVLLKRGLVRLQRVAQDGIRVRASAGAASFRRPKTLRDCLSAARAQVQALRDELSSDPGAGSRREAAARERAAEQRARRIKAALKELAKIGSSKPRKERNELRISTTDPEARVMKMADGGFRPAYNGQFSVDTASQVIVGVEVTNRGSDQGEIAPMTEQIRTRYGSVPRETLVDGGFAGLESIEQAEAIGTKVLAPVATPRDPRRNPHRPLPSDSPVIAAWRRRMGRERTKKTYKLRAATVECVNAIARNRGLQRLLVRGRRKARAVFLWFAIAHNVMRGLTLAPQTS